MMKIWQKTVYVDEFEKKKKIASHLKRAMSKSNFGIASHLKRAMSKSNFGSIKSSISLMQSLKSIRCEDPSSVPVVDTKLEGKPVRAVEVQKILVE
ncbi:hypothetical protein ACFX2F_017299 [Malus domestica]